MKGKTTHNRRFKYKEWTVEYISINGYIDFDIVEIKPGQEGYNALLKEIAKEVFLYEYKITRPSEEVLKLFPGVKKDTSIEYDLPDKNLEEKLKRLRGRRFIIKTLAELKMRYERKKAK